MRSIGSVAPADFDNDGDVDWYATRVVATASLGNLLFRNEGDGTVTDIAATAGVQALDRPTRTFSGTTFFDYDNDGLLDLYVPNGAGGDFLYRNSGDNTFSETTVAAGLSRPEPTSGTAIGDVDGDGLLDLYASVGGQRDALYRNQDDGTFADIGAAAGIDHAPEWGLSNTRFFDADNDGDLDLYGISGDVDFAHIYYRNEGDGTYTEATDAVGLRGSKAASLGLQSGDFDNDGWIDLFITVVGEPNLLYFNNRDGTFNDRAANVGLPLADLHDDLLASAGDYNRDGFVDLFVNNFQFAPVNALFANGGNDNHWLHLELVGVESNRSAIGARVTLQADALSMTRQIGRGETLLVEFGLGDQLRADRIEIQWPSGRTTALRNIAGDQHIRVFEDRPGFFPIAPTVWEATPLDSAFVGAVVPVRALVRPALFEPGARITAVTADLSALGGESAVPLTATGDGRYQLDEALTVSAPHGLKFIPVRIAQTTSLGVYRTTLNTTVIVAPATDWPIYARGLDADWRLEPNARVEVEEQAPGPDNRTAMRFQSGNRLWRVEYIPSELIEPFGFAALRFDFHPGDAQLPTLGARFSVNINIGGQIASILDLEVDLERREWQEITVPMPALNVETPIEFIRLTGNLDGTFYIDDMRLVSAIPTHIPTAVRESQAPQPQSFALAQNYPNPFNGETAIRFALANADNVELEVYNLLGQQVHTLAARFYRAGAHVVRWDGRNTAGDLLSSGVYVYRLRLGDQMQSRNLTLLK